MKFVLALLFAISGAIAAQINGAGASFPANVYMSWVKDYEAQTGTKINYQSIGSGGGVKQVKAKTIDFGASDEALSAKDLKDSNLLQFPTLSGGIVLAYNIDGIKDGELRLSNEALAGIFLGKITSWNDAQIAADNPHLKLPNLKISVVHRSDGSGTTYHFTSYLARISKAWESEVGFGKAISFPVGLGGKGNEGVAQMIKNIKGALGYVELSYKNNLNLSAAKLKSADGEWISADNATIAEASKNAKWDKESFSSDLLLQPKSYPIVNATYILLPKDSALRGEIAKFFNYCFDNGDNNALKMGLVPLSKDTKDAVKSFLGAK